MANTEQLATWAEGSQVVSFFLGDELYSAPVSKVYQILRDIPVTRVPNVGRHVEGVLNLRGRVVPVVDLKHLLGLGVRTLGDDHRLMIVDLEGRLVGLSVDRIGGIVRLEASQLEEAPVADSAGDGLVCGTARHQGARVALLDLARIIMAAEQGMGSEQAEPGGAS
jgi:purine-binding chemotaxis protein CheW